MQCQQTCPRIIAARSPGRAAGYRQCPRTIPRIVAGCSSPGCSAAAPPHPPRPAVSCRHRCTHGRGSLMSGLYGWAPTPMPAQRLLWRSRPDCSPGCFSELRDLRRTKSDAVAIYHRHRCGATRTPRSDCGCPGPPVACSASCRCAARSRVSPLGSAAQPGQPRPARCDAQDTSDVPSQPFTTRALSAHNRTHTGVRLCLSSNMRSSSPASSSRLTSGFLTMRIVGITG